MSLAALKTIKTTYFIKGFHSHARMRVQSWHQDQWFVPYDLTLSRVENHIAALRAFAKERQWQGKWVMGNITDKTCIFIPLQDDTIIEIL